MEWITPTEGLEKNLTRKHFRTKVGAKTEKVEVARHHLFVTLHLCPELLLSTRLPTSDAKLEFLVTKNG